MTTTLIEWPVSLWPKQGEAIKKLADPKIEVLGYGGGKGPGKSHLGRTWQVARRVKYANSKGLMVRKSFPELERTHIERLKRDLPKGSFSYNEQKHIFYFKNGSILECAYVENNKDVDVYWGAEYDDIFVDEMQQHTKYVFQTLRTCVRTTRKDLKAKMLLGFNWGGIGNSWLKKMFWDKIFDEGEIPEQFAFIHGKIQDNPSIMENDPGYVDRLRALPEKLRKAYLDGDPSAFEGQFFSEFGTHLKVPVFPLSAVQLVGTLYGSLDVGTTHPTSFGLWWIDLQKKLLYRLMSYLGKPGLTHHDYAQEIYNRIESFPHTHGYFPDEIYGDPSAWTKEKLNEAMIRAPIDEYIEVFAKKSTKFVQANNNKHNGCQIMRQLMLGRDKNPQLFYWEGFNASFEEGIAALVMDDNDTEIYAKMDGDDEGDQSRYGIVHGYSRMATIQQTEENKKKAEEFMKKRKDVAWEDF